MFILIFIIPQVKFGKPYTDEPVPLSFNKCCELANYYLGFNGWNSRILSVSLWNIRYN